LKALYSAATPVPWSRVIREHRRALVPLGVALAVNVIVLLVVVLPIWTRVAANEERANRAAMAERAAAAEFRQAEAVREGKSRALADLDTFYKQVLPATVDAARRTVQTKTMKLADAHDVQYERGTSDTEEVRQSSLERFTYSLTLSGTYDDIRAFIYELETAPDFVVIDNILLAEGQDTNAPLSLSVDLSTYYRATPAKPDVQAATNGR
jgi:Tfp pilus assembly protein PilO